MSARSGESNPMIEHTWQDITKMFCEELVNLACDEERDALLQLEAFGVDGKNIANGIRCEMRVPAVFVAK
ncbi:hypothetical protein KKE92_05940 [Candidatus Micrarchaeota archaeon]|nr:hypothetical protein [Candidatus Micrarchaeota archaeon]MBU1681596.1 hypothetical protein [Candidatus Micrarchaeota archaeon]